MSSTIGNMICRSAKDCPWVSTAIWKPCSHKEMHEERRSCRVGDCYVMGEAECMVIE